MNIGIDLDNVLADFHTTWLAYHNKHYDTTITNENVTVYDYAPAIGISSEELVRRIYAFYESTEFEDIRPEKGSTSVIGRLSKKHKLYIITSRPDSTEVRTRQWLNRYFPDEIEKILHTNQFSLDHDGAVTKGSMCRKYGITVFIEDAPIYAEETAGAGIKTLLLDQPWNQNVEESKLVTRVASWKDIEREIGKMEG